MHAIDRRQITSLLRVPLTVPTLQLTSDVAVVATQFTQAHGGRVDRVNGGHGVDDRFAGAPTRVGREQFLGRIAITDHESVDELHDVERNTVHIGVVAEPDRGCDGYRSVAKSRDDAVLSAHVMCTGQHVSERRATQNETLTGGAGDSIRQVGVSASDQVEGERPTGPGHVRLEPRGDLGKIDSGDVGTHGPYGIGGSGHFRTLATTGGIVTSMAIDVTDATFEIEVMERSMTTPVVVDLWAPWCGPCKTLGPILEKVIDATGGKVVLAKVNVDENPAISQAFRVQSIPAVYAIDKGAVVNGFQGAYPEQAVQQFVDTLLPTAVDEEIAALVRAGDEDSLRRALELSPGDESAVVALANVLTASGRGEEALQVLARVPESDDVRKAAAAARMSLRPTDDYDHQLGVLIDKVKGDDDARQQFVDILELMGPDDPRTAQWRKKLTARLF